LPRLRTFLLVTAAVVVASAVVVVKTADNKACGSADPGDAKQVGIITYGAGAEEMVVSGNLSLAPLTTEGANHWIVQSPKSQGVAIKVFPLTPGGQTLFQNIGPRTIILRDVWDKSCADSITPPARKSYVGRGILEVY